MSLTIKTIVVAKPVHFVMASRGDDPTKPTMRLSQIPALARMVEDGILAKKSESLLFTRITPTNPGGTPRGCAIKMVINRNTTARVASAWIDRKPAVGNPVSVMVAAIAVPDRCGVNG